MTDVASAPPTPAALATAVALPARRTPCRWNLRPCPARSKVQCTLADLAEFPSSDDDSSFVGRSSSSTNSAEEEDESDGAESGGGAASGAEDTPAVAREKKGGEEQKKAKKKTVSPKKRQPSTAAGARPSTPKRPCVRSAVAAADATGAVTATTRGVGCAVATKVHADE